MIPSLVILAAGSGTRFGGLKQLTPVGPSGETLLEYAAFDAARAGFGRVVLVVREDTEAVFRAQLDSGMACHLPITYAYQRLDDLPGPFERAGEREKPWGTGHAVLAVEHDVEGPIVVVNADDFYGAESYAALAAFFGRNDDTRALAVLGFPIADTLTDAGPVSRAVLDTDERGRLRTLVELPEVWKENGHLLSRDQRGERRHLTGAELVSMNIWGLGHHVLADIRRQFEGFLERSGRSANAEFILPEVIQSMLSDGRVHVEVLPAGGTWCGMTFSEDRQRVRSIISALVEKGEYPAELWTGA